MTWNTCDIHDRFEGGVRVPEVAWRDFGGRLQFGGPVVTVKCFEDNSRLKELGAQPGLGRVLVVDGGGSLRYALLGDVIAADLARNGWAGAVVWGAVRDVVALRSIDLGVKALGSIPRRSVRRGEGQVDLPLNVGGVDWRPGDQLFADEDGVILLAPDADALSG